MSRPGAIVVLGAKILDGRVPRMLEARLATALELLHCHPDLPVVVSGKGEAPAMAHWLQARGVPPERIVQEREATSTNENLENAHRLLPEVTSWLAVTNSFHRWRTMVWAWHLHIPITVINAPTAGPNAPFMFAREALAFPHSVLRVLWRKWRARG